MLLAKNIRLSDNLIKALFLPYSLLLLLFSYILPGGLVSVFLFFIYVASVIIVFNRGTLTDPRTLFLGFLFLYSTFYPLRVLITEVSILKIDYTLIKSTVNYAFIGAISFVTTVNYFIDEKISRRKLPHFSLTSNNTYLFTSERLITFFLLALVLLGLYEVATSGAASKRELSDVKGIVPQLAYFSSLFVIIILAIRLSRLKKSFFKDKITIIFYIFFVIYLLYTGERDTVFRIVLISLLIFFDKSTKANWLLIFFLLSSAAILVPLSQSFKAVLLSGEINLPSLGAEALFNNEFISSSRNLYALQLYGVHHNINFLFTDIIRAFVPTILIPGFDIISTNQWYHTQYREMHGFSGSSGWGFGIIPQGYLFAGVPGIIIIMFLYALVITKFFNIKYRSIYHYIFFISLLLTGIYCIRADVANFLSQTFKIGGIMILILITAHYFLKKEVFKKLVHR